jgi:hypothetical protein
MLQELRISNVDRRAHHRGRVVFDRTTLLPPPSSIFKLMPIVPTRSFGQRLLAV